jgi:uncharacterized protein
LALRLVGEAEIEDIAVGAAILGTGGGGDPYIGKLLAQQAVRQHGPVQMVSVDEVPEDAFVVPSAMMGAPTVMVEKLPRGTEVIRAFEALGHYVGRRPTHTTSIEAGGLNSTTPFVVAAQLGIPLVDADGMGRAFPEIQMIIATMHGVKATPMTLADEKGNSAVIDTIDNSWTERLARTLTVDFGATSMIALYPMSGAQLRAGAFVAGTITLAEELGRLVRETRALHGDPVGAVVDRLGGRRLFTGKIVDVARRTEAGWAKAEVHIDGISGDAGSTLVLHTQNEHLVAIRNEDVVCSVPDLIIVMDAESGGPITTEELRYGYRVVVVGAPCVPPWRTPEGLALVGPRYFGYDVDYIPVEERVGS